MAQAAEARGEKGRYAVTLSRSIYEPFTTFSDRRDLREIAFRAFISRGENGGATDNREVVAKTLALRAEKARLLGYESYAALKLDDTMAKTPSAVFGLLDPVWDRAREKAARRPGRDAAASPPRPAHNHPIAGWDWRYCQEKLRVAEVRLRRGRAEALSPAGAHHRRLLRRGDAAVRHHASRNASAWPTWHPDVRVFEVLNPDGTHLGTFLADYFARASKRSGAWMSGLDSAYRLGKGAQPVIYNVMNFAKPSRRPAGAAVARRGEDAVP